MSKGEYTTLSEMRCGEFTPDRSPGQYTTFTDLYGTKVTVRYSSLATQDAVWIFADNPDPSYGSGAAHLCREMAQEVYEALGKFLREDAGFCRPLGTTKADDTP